MLRTILTALIWLLSVYVAVWGVLTDCGLSVEVGNSILEIPSASFSWIGNCQVLGQLIWCKRWSSQFVLA